MIQLSTHSSRIMAIHTVVGEPLGVRKKYYFDNAHKYVKTKNHVPRKGSIASKRLLKRFDKCKSLRITDLNIFFFHPNPY